MKHVSVLSVHKDVIKKLYLKHLDMECGSSCLIVS